MIALALKATLILAAAFAAAACLRRGPAAVRHFLWTAALAAILALPLASLAPPPAAVQVAFVEPAVVVAAAAAPAPIPARNIPWLAILYAAAAMLAAARFLTGAFRIARAARRAAPSTLGDGFGVRAVLSPEIPVPLAWGMLRPVVVLPAAAASWPVDRLRSVLLHEAMHHRRRDLLAQAVAQTACCLYWWNPLAWLALARQRADRERACDDAVLRHGVAAHDYAAHLVDVVRAAANPRWSGALAMADSSTLETRVRGVLDPHADRRPLTYRAAAAVAAAALVLLAPLTVVNLHAQTGTTISGVVEDPTGARVPNSKVTAKNIDGTNVEVTTADLAGEYRFANIPSGRYELTFASAGFKPARIDVTLVTGATLRTDAHLALGEVSEMVKVVGSRTGAPAQPAPRTAEPRRIRIGGNVQAMRLIHQAKPVYPPELQQAGVEGTVVLRGVVSKTGTVLNPRVISSTDARLNQAALDAVGQWQYQPTLLNGEPVETLTTISIDFKLGQ